MAVDFHVFLQISLLKPVIFYKFIQSEVGCTIHRHIVHVCLNHFLYMYIYTKKELNVNAINTLTEMCVYIIVVYLLNNVQVRRQGITVFSVCVWVFLIYHAISG